MTDLNELHVSGRLVKDVELRSTNTGNHFAWFQLAVNGRKDKEGKQSTDFIVCQLWGKPAELLERFGKKGMRLLITRGSLKTFVKEDAKAGTRQSCMYVLISSFEFLDSLKQQKEGGFFESMGDSVNIDF